jgi:hypothetical protein
MKNSHWNLLFGLIGIVIGAVVNLKIDHYKNDGFDRRFEIVLTAENRDFEIPEGVFLHASNTEEKISTRTVLKDGKHLLVHRKNLIGKTLIFSFPDSKYGSQFLILDSVLIIDRDNHIRLRKIHSDDASSPALKPNIPKPKPKLIVISGIVKFENGELGEKVIVSAKLGGQIRSITTDQSGIFSISIPDSREDRIIYLYYKQLGSPQKSIEVIKENDTKGLTLYL